MTAGLKKAISEVEGILLLITNVALVVIPATTNSLSAGTSAKYAVALNGAAYIARQVQTAVTSKTVQTLTGVSPAQILNPAQQSDLTTALGALPADISQEIAMADAVAKEIQGAPPLGAKA